MIKSRTPYSDLFQSTLPSQGATFNSAILKAKRTFQSTLPSQGATAGNGQAISRAGISIHAPLTGSDAMVLHDEFDFGISIHAPLTGSDPDNFDNSSPDNGISIHAPLTGSDLPAFGQSFCKCRFQSTLPSQGATTAFASCLLYIPYFNPRSPHRERPPSSLPRSCPFYFNPRSPHRERRKLLKM